VCPSPCHTSRSPEPSNAARWRAPEIGVAGSPVVPTTTIGGAPAAAPAGYGSWAPGQNVHGSPELHWRYGYAWSWGLIIVTTVIQIAYYRRKGWI